MGHGYYKPRGGSLQFWPRCRARRIYPRVRSWVDSKDTKILGFAGYKVGMANVFYLDNIPNSITKGSQVNIPVTVIECPPLKPLSLRFYKNSPYGLKLISELKASKFEKELDRKITVKAGGKEIKDCDEVRLVVYTQPGKTGIGKKTPEIFEMGIGGKTIQEKIEYGKSLLDKEIKVSDVFKPGQYIDIHGVSKGKGFQGPIQRFGLSLKAKKSEKKKRSGGNLGPWHPAKVSFTVPQHGQMGFHTRTEYNKLLVSIESDKINPKSGFDHYGVIKNDYILIKGSVAGVRRRLIRFTDSIRKIKSMQPLEIKQVVV